ncbi:MAG: hypothetical protein IAG13_20870 [Deltaproteobacteria bacterium]|nr:hypothetical protein [Nannocystaceae bacterium]
MLELASLLPYLAAASLMLFGMVAAIDGVWLHLWKLRLHTRAASFVEHLWHTASAVLFVPTVALLFVWHATAGRLWLAMALLLAIHIVELFDVRAERESRRELGGLSRAELSIHVLALVSRTAAISLLLLSRPAAIWSLAGVQVRETVPSIVADVGAAITLGATAIAVLHVGFAALYCPQCRRRPAMAGGGA